MHQYEIELKLVETELNESKGYDPYYSNSHYKYHPYNCVNHTVKRANKQILELIARKDALRMTIRRLRTHILYSTDRSVEADVEVKQNFDDNPVDVYENFEDTSGMAANSQTYGNADTLKTGQYNVLDMSNFLSRPLKMAQTEVKEGDNLTLELDIWELFTSHPSVRAKLRNYAYFSGTMNVRITVSGTPWHFGKLQASYQPLAGKNKNLDVLVPMLATANRYAALTYLSQAKGATTIDVHDNQPLEVVCPFISPQPMLRLFNKSALILPDATPFSDFVGFGTLYINSISAIQAVGATATPVGIQVYAWVTDLELGVPTGTVIEIGTEADTEIIYHQNGGGFLRKVESKDEREAGPVEKIASGAALIAKHASNLPVIGRFAHAAFTPLKTIAQIASLFGFSYPTMINKPERIKNEPFQNSAQFIGYDTGQRITIDPKQQLSVDPVATGTEIDELSYAYLCSTESLLDTFTWETADGQMASSIWMAPVNPNIAKRILTAVGPPPTYIVAPTPLGFTATPHQWWRGDITFRFEIVCSQFHRGTLAVLFEPNISQNVVIDTTLDLNKQFIKKVDLQSCTDFEVTVKWAYPRPWARVLTPDLLGDIGAVGFLGDSLFDYANGYIAVVPYTALQSPDDSSISINVYIRSEDMSFNQFTMINVPTVRPSVEASTEVHLHTPHPVDSSVLNESSAVSTDIATLTFGEMPISFRSALKRFSPWFINDTVKLTTNTAYYSYTYINQWWSNPTPSYSSNTGNEINLFGYLRYAYLGFRGGTKHRLNPTGPVPSYDTSTAIITLVAPNSTPGRSIAWNTDFQRMSPQAIGSAMFMPATNAGVEFEVPMYTPNLFLVSFDEDLYPSGSIMDDEMTWGYEATFGVAANAGTSATYPVFMCSSSAAAEDFSLMRFSGCPIFQYEG